MQTSFRALRGNQMNEILFALKNNPEGLTITELVTETGLSRSKVRILLAHSEGAMKINFRKVGMAKVYKIK